jgi:hypothetical protein
MAMHLNGLRWVEAGSQIKMRVAACRTCGRGFSQLRMSLGYCAISALLHLQQCWVTGSLLLAILQGKEPAYHAMMMMGDQHVCGQRPAGVLDDCNLLAVEWRLNSSGSGCSTYGCCSVTLLAAVLQFCIRQLLILMHEDVCCACAALQEWAHMRRLNGIPYQLSC